MHLYFDAIFRTYAYFITHFTCLTHAYFLQYTCSSTLWYKLLCMFNYLASTVYIPKLTPIHLIRPPFSGRLGSGFKERRCKGSSCAWKNVGSLGGGGQLHTHHGIKCTRCRKNGYLCSEAHNNLSGRSELNWPLRGKERRRIKSLSRVGHWSDLGEIEFLSFHIQSPYKFT